MCSKVSINDFKTISYILLYNKIITKIEKLTGLENLSDL